MFEQRTRTIVTMKIICCTSAEDSDSEEILLKSQDQQNTYNDETKDLDRDCKHKSNHRSTPDASTQQYTKTLLLGYVAMCIGTVEVSLAQAAVQLLNRSMPHWELNGLRFATQVLLTLFVVMFTRNWDLKIQRDLVGWTVIGAIAMIVASIAAYGAVFYLPVGLEAGIERSLDLSILFGFSSVVSRTIHWNHAIAVCSCLAGLLMVVQPPLMFRNPTPTLLNLNVTYTNQCGNYTIDTSLNFNISGDEYTGNNHTSGVAPQTIDKIKGYSLAVTGAISIVIVILVLRYKLHDMRTLTFLFWQGMIGVVISFGIMALMETPTIPDLPVCTMFLWAHMLLSGSHNLLIFYGYQIAVPTISGLLQTIQIPTNFVLQFTILSGLYPGNANIVGIIGAIVVVIGNALVPIIETIRYLRSAK